MFLVGAMVLGCFSLSRYTKRAACRNAGSHTHEELLVSPLGSRCASPQPAPQAEFEPDLTEWDYGDYEGKLSSDIHKHRPDWNVFRHGCPGGELPADVAARADRLITHLCTMDGNIALFSHGQFGVAGRAMDRTAGGRGATFLAQHRIGQHPEL